MSGAETILLLHGQPGSARDWDRVRAALDGRAESIAIDRPGWNGSSGPADLEGNAAAALGALDAAGAERGVVVGHSFGGAVALWLAIRHPDRVSALVLAAPAATVSSLVPLDYVLAAPIVGDLLSAAALSGVGAALAARPVRSRLARALAVEDPYLRQMARTLIEPAGWRAFASEQRTLVRELPGLENRLGSIAAPVTILAGTADRVVPLSSARALAADLPSARLIELRRANHLLPQHRATDVARAILDAALRG